MSNELMPQEDSAATDPGLLANELAPTQTESTTETTETPEAAEAPGGSEEVDVAPRGPSFDDMKLSREVRDALDDLGYFTPTPVQAAVFGPLAEGKDLMVQSKTGTGKTAAFGLPIVE